MTDHVLVDQRRHGVVLVRPLARSLVLAAVGVGGFRLGWPASLAGGVLLLAAAAYALAAVVRWDRTQVVLTSETLFVRHGLLRRDAASIRLDRVQAIELRQSIPGRVLGYGTVVAGDLEITAVPRARDVVALAQRH
jgi:uncharacterized membrane protein YdbT with pleckstrin-like domain